MTVLFVANMMMWSAVSPSAGPVTTPGRDRETERQRESSPLLLLTSLSSAELSATDRRHSGLRAVSLLSTHSNSIIHKKSLRFLRKIKVAYICLYSINEMIDRYVIRYYMVKTKTQLFVLVK